MGYKDRGDTWVLATSSINDITIGITLSFEAYGCVLGVTCCQLRHHIKMCMLGMPPSKWEQFDICHCPRLPADNAPRMVT